MSYCPTCGTPGCLGSNDEWESTPGWDLSHQEVHALISNGEGPTLYRPDVEVLLREGTIRPKWRDASLHCYVLSDDCDSKA
jgi:hypothetical protein